MKIIKLLGYNYGQVCFFFRERLIYFNFTCDISGTIAGMLLYRLGCKDWKEKFVLPRVKVQCAGLGKVMRWVLLSSMEKISNDSITMGGSPRGIAILWYISDDQEKMSEVARIRVKDVKGNA